MRKWRFTRPAASPLAAALLALGIAVAAHAVLLIPDYRTPGDDTASSTSGIRILNLASFTPEQQKNFRNWRLIHDPARVAKSSSKSGYSAAIERKTQLNVQIKPYKMAEIQSQVKMTAFSPLPTGGTPQKSIPAPPVKKTAQQSVRTAVVFDENGKKINHAIGIIPLRLGSSRPTVISVKGFGKVAGITVTRSCGSRELDLLALNTVLKMGLKQKTALTFIWPGKDTK